MRISAIEIGTNSIKFNISDFQRNKPVQVIEKMNLVNRLSEGMYHSRMISEEGMERSIKTTEYFMELAKMHRARVISIFSTSVLRDAENKQVFIQRMFENFGIPVEVISGEREAYLAYKACSPLFDPAKETYAVIDIGGGSTEITVGYKDRIMNRISMDIGAVRLIEHFIHSDPVYEHELEDMSQYITSVINKGITLKLSGFQFVGTGGTIRSLGTIFKELDYKLLEQISGISIHQNEIENIYLQLKSKPLVERMKVTGLDPKRADIIIAGLDILLCVMNHLVIDRLTISTNGVLEGFLQDYFEHI